MADTRLYKVAITPCGKYVHGTEYDRLCLVLNATEDGGDGCSYISLQKNKNVRPGTDNTIWALSLERGERGQQGLSGAGFSDVEITVNDTTGTPSGTAVIANDTLYLSFSGMKGATGEIDEEQLQDIENQIAAKQDALVSGTNIKTIGNQSILGSGNIQVGDENAVKFVSQSLIDSQKTQARTNIGAGTYSKPSGGIPASDLASGVIPDVSGKQDTISDLATIRSGAVAGATAYQKPGTGIPASDLASGVIPTVPTISTNISTDASSDAKTASPKAVKTYVDGVASAINDDIDGINDDIEDIGIAIETIGNGAFVVAWDGESTPVAANIPAGVSVTYGGTTYTGSLSASASTLGKIYLVATGTSGNYDRYVTVGSSTYSWAHIGTTSVALEEYATNSKVGQLEAEVDEVDGLRVSTSPVDLSFEDGDGNVLVKFSDGHIEVENFDSRDVADISTDTTDEADLEFSDPDGNAIVRFIDGHIKTKNFDSSDVSNKKPYARETYFKTKVDCVQMNASSFDSTNPNAYVSQVLYQDNCVLLLPDSYTPGGKPTRLIIFCKQGNNQITDSSNPILTSNAMGNIFHFLLARGYAVLGADGVPDGLSTALGLDDTRVSGSYAAVQSTREAYDYVIENYNIDKTGAFIFGYSQGGIYAQNVIDLSGIPFLGCAMVSPSVSMRFHLWDLSSTKEIGGVTWTKTSRLNIARLYGFDEVETDAELLALQFNREKVAGYDPWFRNVENPYEGFTQTSAYGSNLWALPSGTSIDTITMKKKIGCPTKIWAAVNDSTLGTDVTKVFVKACRNAGQVCDLHLYNDGNHHIFQSTYQSPAISTFSDQGNSYNLYPITYEIASFFYRCGGLSLTD